MLLLFGVGVCGGTIDSLIGGGCADSACVRVEVGDQKQEKEEKESIESKKKTKNSMNKRERESGRRESGVWGHLETKHECWANTWPQLFKYRLPACLVRVHTSHVDAFLVASPAVHVVVLRLAGGRRVKPSAAGFCS